MLSDQDEKWVAKDMMSELDGLVVLVLFAIRIGLPIALTLAFGYWLERKLQPEKRSEWPGTGTVTRRPVHSPKVIRLYCWDVMRCRATERAQCAAFKYPDLPCWLALQVDGDKVRQECFTCELYRPQKIAA